MSKVLITVNPVYEWNDELSAYVLASHDGQYWAEPSMLACGASGAEKAASNQQARFAQMLYNNYANYFGKQSSVLQDIRSQLEPILSAGPNQTGFSAAENAALNTEAVDTNAAAAERAGGAVSSTLAGRGDNSGIESGVDRQIQAGIKSKSAQALASQQNEITAANYETGRENYFKAAGALGGVAEAYNPNAIAGEFNNAESSEFGMESTIQQQNQALGKDIAGGLVGLAGDISFTPGKGFGFGGK